MQEQTAGAAEGAARRQEGVRMRGSSDAGVRSPEHAGESRRGAWSQVQMTLKAREGSPPPPLMSATLGHCWSAVSADTQQPESTRAPC